MIRYRYSTQLQPPAPFVLISARNPADGALVRNLPAQVDSAADRTVITSQLVEDLHLPQIGSILVGGLGGAIYSLPAYVIGLGIHDFQEQTIKVIASADEPWILLGRDVLNAHRFTLDGPQLALEFGLAAS